MIKTIELDKYNVLNSEEERELIRRYQQENDQQALNKLVNHNIKFIIHVVNKKLGANNKDAGARNHIKDDLIQESYFAMVKAAKNFDLNRPGIKYIQYLKFWLTASRQTYFEKNNNIVRNSAGDIVIQNNGSASADGQNQNGLDKFMNNTVAKENFKCFDNDLDAYETIVSQTNRLKLNELVNKIKQRLSDKEISILSDRLMSDEPLTLAEIGAKYSISRERIRQIESRLIDKLRREFNDKGVAQDWT